MLPLWLLLVATVLLACILLNRVSSKLGIPMLLAFILLGMLFGSDGLVKIPFDNYAFAEHICSVALIVIMFYGGFGTKWSEARPIAVKAGLLSSLGVAATAGLTGLFCHLALGMPLREGMLLGAVVGSTDAASVFSILRSKRLNLKYRTASLLEVESGSNDPCSYMLTTIVLMMMEGTAQGGKLAWMIFAQLFFGVLFGFLIAFGALWVLGRFRFAAGFETIFVLAVAILAYAVSSLLGGNGYLSAYIAGIVLGNHPLKDKAALVHFFDGVTGLMQMLIFFLLGLQAFPSELPRLMVPALLTALFLTFVARPAAVFFLLSPFRCPVRQSALVSWAGLRGAASIVFAIMATVSPARISYDIFHFVFCIVIFSILFQGSLLPAVARKLDMIDAGGDVLKTFNDYQEEVPVQFIQFSVPEGHPWSDKAVREVVFPPGTLLVQLKRGEESIAPRGDAVLRAGDSLILSASALEGSERVRLSELCLEEGHQWVGLPLSELSLDPDKLIIMVQRQGEVLIPTGQTVLEAGDVLVINQGG